MLQHFQYKPLFVSEKIPGWSFSFYFQNAHYTGLYHGNGAIEWHLATPDEEFRNQLEKQIHELMLYHVYEG